MWTLATARDRVSSRVGEDSPVFWSETDRNDAINDAQRFIAAVTNGVPLTTAGTVDESAPYLEVAGSIAGMHGSAGRIAGGAALSMVRIDVADMHFPGWRTYAGSPRWVIVDTGTSRAYLAPVPTSPTSVEVTVSVIPDDLTSDSETLFGGIESMSKYLGALVNYAAAMLLLRERFDGDAERFYQFAVQELVQAGVDPARVPPLKAQPQEGS